jgi:predicted TIM-barrel fold metal-dependent hydrolase
VIQEKKLVEMEANAMSERKVHKTMRTIALEEAFLHPRLWEVFPPSLQKRYALIKDRLTDVGPERIRRMDAAGIDLQVLSHVGPGVQIINEPGQAIKLSREVNNWLGEVVKAYPTRFAGFAMLPTQSPQDAADELERTVTQLGLKGALINGHTNGRYLDDESFSVLFERAQALDVPIYIHPTDPPQAITDVYYRNYPAMVIGWGWLVETGTHLLRLICSGVFDRYPRLKIIVGHMGELIPYCLTRLNVSLTMGNWLLASQEAAGTSSALRRGVEKNILYYMRENVFITTSGVFDHPVFNCAHAVLGIDNILFSVDEPFQDSFEAMDFMNTTQLSKEDREKLAHGNAERLLKIAPATAPRVDLALSPAGRLRSSLFAFRAKTKSKMGRALVNLMVK